MSLFLLKLLSKINLLGLCIYFYFDVLLINLQFFQTLNHLNGFKPLYTDVAESKTILQSMQTQQSEQNMRVDNKLEEMNSLLLG